MLKLSSYITQPQGVLSSLWALTYIKWKEEGREKGREEHRKGKREGEREEDREEGQVSECTNHVTCLPTIDV